MKKIIILLFSLFAVGFLGCDEQPICIEGSTQIGTTPCGENGYYLQVCENSIWVDDLNICEENNCNPGSVCDEGPWIDGGNCTCDSVLESYGLGSYQSEYVTALPRSYDWYRDQYKTGVHSKSNCGPTAASMAIKWADWDFVVDIEAARKRYRPLGGAWYTTDVMYYLEDNSVPYYLFEINDNMDIIKQEIDDGKILIFCIDASKLSYNSNGNMHVDRFYTQVTGHYVIGKGYTMIDNVLYIEVYDPFSMNSKYPNSSQLKGKNRYFKWENEFSVAISSWWNYAIAVKPKSDGTVFEVFQKTNEYIVNPDEIIHMSGGM